MNKNYFLLFSLVVLIVSTSILLGSEKTPSELSYYLGYRFWKDWKEKKWVQVNLKEAIKGMEVAQEGKVFCPTR